MFTPIRRVTLSTIQVYQASPRSFNKVSENEILLLHSKCALDQKQFIFLINLLDLLLGYCDESLGVPLYVERMKSIT